MVNEARSASKWMNIGSGKNRNRDRNINNSVIGEIAPAIVGV